MLLRPTLNNLNVCFPISERDKHPKNEILKKTEGKIAHRFIKSSDGIDITAAAIVFRHIASKRFVDIGRCKNKQKSIFSTKPW